MLLFKILKDGRSCHGGELAWELPTQQTDGSWVPAEWREIAGPLSLCSHGFHLTTAPNKWWLDGVTAWIAESDGESISSEEKSCHRRVRLMRPASEKELADHGVFPFGMHRLSSGHSTLSGDATATLCGHASAKLYGNATATLFDDASATLSGDATATLCDHATATLSGNATANDYTGRQQVVEGFAVLVDRTAAPPKIITGGQEASPSQRSCGE